MGIRQPVLNFEPTVPALLRHAVDHFGEREFVVTDVSRITYRDAELLSRRLAKRLIMFGVGKGTRIATMFPYGIEWIISWLAIERIGALHIPLSTAYKPAELRLSLQLCDAHLLIAPQTLFGQDHQAFVADALPGIAVASQPIMLPLVPFLRGIWFEGTTDLSWASGVSILQGLADEPDTPDELLLAAEQQVTPADLALIIYTSGTSSRPKGVCHTHGALVRKGAHIAALREWSSQDKVFCGLPFFWVGGVGSTVLPAVVVGATLLCVDKTDPLRSLDLMEREGATVMMGWPGVRGPISTHPTRASRNIPALEVPDFGFGRAHSSLGMTETLGSYTFAMGGDEKIPIPPGHVGSMGPPIDGAEVCVVDPDTLQPVPEGTEGVILVRGYFLTAGLYKREREDVFTLDGFYNTQDRGYILGELVFFAGRQTDVIKTSGNNVSPSEVEVVLGSLPEVRLAHVLGIADPERGEIVAALIATTGDAGIDANEVRAKARAELSNFKVPRKVIVVDEKDVPWLHTGKLDRLAIRRLLETAVDPTQRPTKRASDSAQ